MQKTRKTHWFGKYTEFCLESENMLDIIEEATIILDVAVIFLPVKKANVKGFLFLVIIIVTGIRNCYDLNVTS
jgi:hypothetical protein